MGNFFNNGPKILKLIVRVCIYHIYISKNFFLNIYRSQMDDISLKKQHPNSLLNVHTKLLSYVLSQYLDKI